MTSAIDILDFFAPRTGDRKSGAGNSAVQGVEPFSAFLDADRTEENNRRDTRASKGDKYEDDRSAARNRDDDSRNARDTDTRDADRRDADAASEPRRGRGIERNSTDGHAPSADATTDGPAAQSAQDTPGATPAASATGTETQSDTAATVAGNPSLTAHDTPSATAADPAFTTGGTTHSGAVTASEQAVPATTQGRQAIDSAATQASQAGTVQAQTPAGTSGGTQTAAAQASGEEAPGTQPHKAQTAPSSAAQVPQTSIPQEQTVPAQITPAQTVSPRTVSTQAAANPVQDAQAPGTAQAQGAAQQSAHDGKTAKTDGTGETAQTTQAASGTAASAAGQAGAAQTGTSQTAATKTAQRPASLAGAKRTAIIASGHGTGGTADATRTGGAVDAKLTPVPPTPVQPQPNPAGAAQTPLTPERLAGFSDSQPFGPIGGGLSSLNGEADPLMGQRLFGARPSPSLGSQVSQQLNAHISRAVSDGRQEFTMRLDPPELGKLMVRLQFSDSGTIRAQVLVQRPETLDLLQRDLRGLERALEAGGHKLDGGIDLGLDKDGGQSAGRSFTELVQAERMEEQRHRIAASLGLDGDDDAETAGADGNGADGNGAAGDTGETITLDAILDAVTPETGVDVRV